MVPSTCSIRCRSSKQLGTLLRRLPVAAAAAAAAWQQRLLHQALTQVQLALMQQRLLFGATHNSTMQGSSTVGFKMQHLSMAMCHAGRQLAGSGINTQGPRV
jgi:hypothetical protein